MKEENDHYLRMIAKLRDENAKLKLEYYKKEYLLEIYKKAQQSNLEIHNSLIQEYEDLKKKYELLLADHGNLQAEYDAVKGVDVVEESQPSSSDKEFVPDVHVDVVQPQRQITQLFTRSRRRTQPVDVPTVDIATTIEQAPDVLMSIPPTAEAERLAEKAAGRLKIDEVLEVTEPTESSTKQKIDDTLLDVQANTKKI